MIGRMASRILLALALMLGLAAGVAADATAQQARLQGFPTASAAADALTEAIQKDDSKTIDAILGPGWFDSVVGDPDDLDKLREKFLAAWQASHQVVVEGDKATVEVGTTGWVSPIPIVKEGSEWRYDVVAGRKEIVARRIGRDELSVIQSLLAIVDAQHEYAALDPMKAGTPAYARRLLSTPGTKNGLYWETAPGEPESPLGPALATAQSLGQGGSNHGYYGYRFRLLYGQGPDAQGGAHDYLVDGRMMGGFAVIAWPVKYDDTGVMTFIVNQGGTVYERDLGPDTEAKAAAISLFNPDKEWDKADTTPP
ncbi:MAG: hypothetical protein BGN99_15510 [Alphaproteobacteria bacterium 65-37]|jgi:hypothetical protein|nr:MAG: hypothetical protein BGN99_15510 [Alphaproteobacteria bacterium 65-37]